MNWKNKNKTKNQNVLFWALNNSLIFKKYFIIKISVVINTFFQISFCNEENTREATYPPAFPSWPVTLWRVSTWVRHRRRFENHSSKIYMQSSDVQRTTPVLYRVDNLIHSHVIGPCVRSIRRAVHLRANR